MNQHLISHDDLSIFIDYAFAIDVENTKQITEEVIEILKQNDHPMNIVLDLKGSYLTDNNAIAIAGKMLKPYKKRINTTYIIGASGIQKIFLQTLFKLIGGKKDKHLQVMPSLDAVLKDVEIRWSHYQNRHLS